MERPLKKGPVSVRNMKNGEEVIQYHRGRLKLIRKEFGKLFEFYQQPKIKKILKSLVVLDQI